MDQGDARMFWSLQSAGEENWNIVVLESHRALLQQIDVLIRSLQDSGCTRSEMKHRLGEAAERFGPRFPRFLVRELRYADEERRQDIVWLLTVLKDVETVAPLQRLAGNKRLARGVRLSAALALAGMGVTEDMQSTKRLRLYAIS